MHTPGLLRFSGQQLHDAWKAILSEREKGPIPVRPLGPSNHDNCRHQAERVSLRPIRMTVRAGSIPWAYGEQSRFSAQTGADLVKLTTWGWWLRCAVFWGPPGGADPGGIPRLERCQESGPYRTFQLSLCARRGRGRSSEDWPAHGDEVETIRFAR